MRYLLLTFLTCLLAVHMKAQANNAAAAAPIQQAQEQLKTSTTDESIDTQTSDDDENPCQREKTERQLESCLSEKFQRAESELNRIYKEIMASLNKGQQARLRKEERGWIKWREAECARQVEDVENCVNGCGVASTMHIVCMTKEAMTRVQRMKGQWHR